MEAAIDRIMQTYDLLVNRTAAANRLGISLRQIRYRMDRLKIEVPGGDDGQ